MFTGRELDSETGNYYYRARYYSPDLGRFLSPDPIGYADSVNLYQYCLNNPINYVDPYGLMSSLTTPSGAVAAKMAADTLGGSTYIPNPGASGVGAVSMKGAPILSKIGMWMGALATAISDTFLNPTGSPKPPGISEPPAPPVPQGPSAPSTIGPASSDSGAGTSGTEGSNGNTGTEGTGSGTTTGTGRTEDKPKKSS